MRLPETRDIMAGPGDVTAIAGTDPDAGNQVQETVPDGELWVVQAFAFDLVTDGTAADRGVHLQVLDSDRDILVDVYAGVTQGASATWRYVFAPGAPSTGQTDDVVGQMFPPVAVPAGCSIETATVNMQAADDFGPPALLVEKFSA